MALEQPVHSLKQLLEQGFGSGNQGCTKVTEVEVSTSGTHPEDSLGEDHSGTSASSIQIKEQASEIHEISSNPRKAVEVCRARV